MMTAGGRDASLVKAGSEAIVQWRREHLTEIIDAKGAMVANLDLSGSDLSDADLGGSCFSQCDLRHVSFARANLKGASFELCDLQDVDFRGAVLKSTAIKARRLDGARFGDSSSIGRIAKLHVMEGIERPISVDRCLLPWYDRWIGWDRLRFLATIRIFVPAYASLSLTVLYLNGISWYNSFAEISNAKTTSINDRLDFPFLPVIAPSWTHALVLLNFICLAVAATCFLACPARVTEFSRERWLNEFHQPELFYDHETWRRPVLRTFCAGALIAGGLLSAFLLGKAVIKQSAVIIYSVN